MADRTDLLEFSAEVRGFLDEKLTPEIRHYGDVYAPASIPRAVATEWLRILDQRGWAVPEWPVEHGGTGWSVEQVVTFKRELTLARAPRLNIQSVDLLGPVVIEYGTEMQKREILPRIRSGEDWWAQGYSEPDAGSDLAGLKCRAERDGDEFVINGTKIWTTYAHECNKIFCLVRTDDTGRPQAGISFLMFDLGLPGIEVRPILTFGGHHELNQVFFSDVRVPASALLGEENDGWAVAKFLLVGERAHSFAAGNHVYLERIRNFAMQTHDLDMAPLISDPAIDARLSSLGVELASLDALEQKIFTLLEHDKTAAGALSSVTKILGSQLQQRITESGIELLQSYAGVEQPILQPHDSLLELIGIPTGLSAVATSQYFHDRVATIAGGTTEVQKNIVATRVLGL